MNVISILNNRKSVRNYLQNEVNVEILNKIIMHGANSAALYNDIDVQFKLIVDGHQFSKKIRGHAGYFGKVFDAPHYIVAVSEDKNGFLENIGYRMENLMIKAHEFGISTCWMELLFGTDKMSKILDIKEGYKALVFTPLGYEKASLIEKFIKAEKYNEKQRKELNEIITFDKWHNYRKRKTELESEYLKILDYARLSPSWGNKQPWRFLIDGESLLIFCKKEKFVTRKRKLNYYKIDCGIIMLYIKLLADTFGITGRWRVGSPKDSLSKYSIPNDFECIGSFITQ
ncbi:nitroreductase family protein [Wukongibacter baidiensis]|uniref:nitroreductase family protein n=1 Tax=Wukongibacter baidiensis TaxID=1723361 RepID=UPI003D8001B4